MLVFLDANALMKDPLGRGVAWPVLVHAPGAWNVRLVTSEVAVEEAAAGYLRQVDALCGTITSAASRDAGRLGLREDVTQLVTELRGRSQDYPTTLQELLATASVSVSPAPSVAHMDIVRRATARRPPCDREGNGYRDTLLWLSFLELCQQNPDTPIVFVTEDTDFVTKGTKDLRPELVEELEAIGAAGNVTTCATLTDVITSLLAEISPANSPDLRQLRSELRSETVKNYSMHLIQGAMPLELDVEACGLPLRCVHSDALDVSDVVEFDFGIRGSSGAEEAIATFTATLLMRISLVLDAPDEIPEGSVGGSVSSWEEKLLVVEGALRLGRLDKPTGGEVVRVFAPRDDPGHLDWRKLRARQAAAASGALLSLAEQQEAIKRIFSSGALAGLAAQQESVRRMFSSGALAGLAAQQESVRRMFSSGALAGIAEQQQLIKRMLARGSRDDAGQQEANERGDQIDPQDKDGQEPPEQADSDPPAP